MKIKNIKLSKDANLNEDYTIGLSSTGILTFKDANGTVTSNDFLTGGSGFTWASVVAADLVAKNAAITSASTFATNADVIIKAAAITSASTYADKYASNNNMYTIQYNDGADGFAGNSEFTFNGTLNTPSITIGDSGTTQGIYMFDIATGTKYGVAISGGTFVITTA
jgi:hypothetical protein